MFDEGILVVGMFVNFKIICIELLLIILVEEVD